MTVDPIRGRNTPAATTASDGVADADAALSAAECPFGLVLARDRRIAWCNERFAADFGYSTAQLQGQSLALLYPSEAEFTRTGERGGAALADDGHWRDDRLMRLHDGSLRWFRAIGRATDRTQPLREAVWVFEPLAASQDAVRLSPREREVLSLLTQGHTAKSCARLLGISPRTVEKCVARLRQRVGARNVAELMARLTGLPE
jgi:DNA-binding CsgD family transcriptional regulator